MKTYKTKRKLGIDNLLCECAFVGNSQGDDSGSNKISDYVESKGWMSITSGFENIADNQEAIYEESKRRCIINLEYIEKLKAEGRYGEEYEIAINLHPSPDFDTPTNKGDPPLSSYRMIILDMKKLGLDEQEKFKHEQDKKIWYGEDSSN